MKPLHGKTKAGILLITLLLTSTLVSATGDKIGDDLINAIDDNCISNEAVNMDALQVGGTWDEDDYPESIPPGRSGYTFVIRRFGMDIFNHIPIYCKGGKIELMKRCDGIAHWANFTGQLRVQWYRHADWEYENISWFDDWNYTTWQGFDFETKYSWYPPEDFYYAEISGVTTYDIGDPQDLVVKPMYGRRYYLDGSGNSPFEKKDSTDPYQQEDI